MKNFYKEINIIRMALQLEYSLHSQSANLYSKHPFQILQAL